MPSSPSSVFTFGSALPPLTPFLLRLSSLCSSPAALAFFGVALDFLLGVALLTPPAGAASVAEILERFSEFQRARREPAFL